MSERSHETSQNPSIGEGYVIGDRPVTFEDIKDFVFPNEQEAQANVDAALAEWRAGKDAQVYRITAYSEEDGVELEDAQQRATEICNEFADQKRVRVFQIGEHTYFINWIIQDGKAVEIHSHLMFGWRGDTVTPPKDSPRHQSVPKMVYGEDRRESNIEIDIELMAKNKPFGYKEIKPYLYDSESEALKALKDAFEDYKRLIHAAESTSSETQETFSDKHRVCLFWDDSSAIRRKYFIAWYRDPKNPKMIRTAIWGQYDDESDIANTDVLDGIQSVFEASEPEEEKNKVETIKPSSEYL